MATPVVARARERAREQQRPAPRERLAKQLQAFTRPMIGNLCDEIGLDRKIGNRARAGRDVNASAYLALCAAIGIDSRTGEACGIKPQPGPVLWWFLGAGFFLERVRLEMDLRKAAKAAGISLTTAQRVNAGELVGTESFLKVCAFIGVPPEGFTARVPPQCFMTNVEVEHAGEAA